MSKTKETPSVLNTDAADQDFYDRLKKELPGDYDLKDLFLFAMSVGFKYQLRTELTRKEGLIRASYLKRDDVALMNALAIYESKSIDVLDRTKDVYKIAEEYAHSGIKIIIDEIDNQQIGTFSKTLTRDVIKQIDEILKTEK